MSDVTHILSAIEQGDPHAAEQLLPLVYDELRKLAAQKLAHEKPGQTLEPTALVHEAYLRLVASGGRKSPDGSTKDGSTNQGADTPRSPGFAGRGHFFAAAAEAMRRILVENARRKLRHKHGGGRRRTPLTEAQLGYEDVGEELLAIHEALDKLAEEDSEAAQLVKLRYFAGMSVEEAAQAIGLPRSTAYVHWAYAKASLRVLLAFDPDEFPS